MSGGDHKESVDEAVQHEHRQPVFQLLQRVDVAEEGDLVRREECSVPARQVQGAPLVLLATPGSLRAVEK